MYIKLDPGNTNQAFFASILWYGKNVFFNLLVSFIDVDECSVMPDICGTAVCKNIPGDFECECAEGYKYNPVLKSCEGRVVTVSLLMVERVGVSLDLRLEALVLFDIQSDFLGWQAP